METEMPLAIKKFIGFIEHASYWDSDCREPAYYDIINRMDSNEEVYDIMTRRYHHIEEKLDELCKKLDVIRKTIEKDMDNFRDLVINVLLSNKVFNKELKGLALKMADHYSEIGRLMDDYGIIDILLERSNKTFTNMGYQFLKTDKRTAMLEFDTRKNYITSYFALSMKMMFQINKIAKFIDSIEYGKMLYNDRMNSKESSEKRIKILSNLKTEYLRKVIEAKNCMTEEEQQNFDIVEKEYYRIFGAYFNNLNYKEDLEKISEFESRKKMMYKHKENILAPMIGMTLNNVTDQFIDRDIKATGMSIDDNGKVVMGMNLYSYPMPITVHVPRSSIENMIEAEKYRKTVIGGGTYIAEGVKKYKVLHDKKGKVFPTNILYKPNETQRALIVKAYKENPDDDVIKFFYTQIATKDKDKQDTSVYKIDELLK